MNSRKPLVLSPFIIINGICCELLCEQQNIPLCDCKNLTYSPRDCINCGNCKKQLDDSLLQLRL